MTNRFILILMLLACSCKKDEVIICEGSYRGKSQAETSHCVQGTWDIIQAEGGTLPGPVPLTDTQMKVTATDSIYYWKNGQLAAATKIVWKKDAFSSSDAFNVITFSGSQGTSYQWTVLGTNSGKLTVFDIDTEVVYTMEK